MELWTHGQPPGGLQASLEDALRWVLLLFRSAEALRVAAAAWRGARRANLDRDVSMAFRPACAVRRRATRGNRIGMGATRQGRVDWDMVRSVKLGDVVRLPSGLEARITSAANPQSPWRVVSAGAVSLLFRVATGEDDRPFVHFFGGDEAPSQFVPTDAAVLAELLNRAKPITFRVDRRASESCSLSGVKCRTALEVLAGAPPIDACRLALAGMAPSSAVAHLVFIGVGDRGG